MNVKNLVDKMKKILLCIIAMMFLFPTIFPLTISSDNYGEGSYQLLRVPLDSVDDRLLQFAEIVGGKPGEYLDIIYPFDKKIILNNAQVPFEILIDDMAMLSTMNQGQYHTYDEMETILEATVGTYPEITSLKSIGTSYEGNDIWCLEITDNPGVDENEPGVLFMGVHHAREWPTLEICLHLIETLTSLYSNDSMISELVDNRRIWIVPCVNPDGFIFDHDENDGDLWWRKNRHYFEEYDTYGVDLNRNYGGSCNGDPVGMWGSTGMSHFPSNDIYCGTSPFSEVETQIIKNLFLSEDICATISWHTYSELVMWPWGYDGDEKAPDEQYMSEVGIEIASRITNQDGSGTYTPTQSAGLYPTTGDTTDWVYGYYHYVLGKPLFAYTIEACQSFHPDESYMDQVCAENVEGALYLIAEADMIDEVVPRVLPPSLDTVGIEPDGSFTISWSQKNPDANPSRYQIQELTNLYLYTDSCEIDEAAWVLDGFVKSTDRSYSGTMSYGSGKRNNQVTSMTLQDPLYVEIGMSLSFYCTYDIEDHYDMAFVEVSTDGRFYDVLDTFTGTSSEWAQHNYSLEKYVGQSIFIRFRYSTDSQTLGNGFFVDDIYPVSDFRSITTLSDSVADQEYTISSRPDGIYYYRVSGFNEEHGWGDDSMIAKVNVDITDNQPPSIPSITGNPRGKPGERYEYTFTAMDDDGDELYYYISWGDGVVDEWIGPYESGEELLLSHTWSEKGDYVIKVRVKDTQQRMGEWGTLPVTMPKYPRALERFIDLPFFYYLSSFIF